jgi:hypothetical protein
MEIIFRKFQNSAFILLIYNLEKSRSTSTSNCTINYSTIFKTQTLCAIICAHSTTTVTTIKATINIIVDIITIPISNPTLITASSCTCSFNRCCSSRGCCNPSTIPSSFKALTFFAICCINIRSTAISTIKKTGFNVVDIITVAICMPTGILATFFIRFVE